jgi:hypothetical protein
MVSGEQGELGVPGFRQVLSLALVLALLLVQAVMGDAATTKKKPVEKAPVLPSMAFAIVRSGIVGCEPNCPQWISAEGQIMPGSANQFRKILKQAGDLRLPVVITSPGGDVEAALAIGQMIRQRKLDVLVGWTLFTGCNPTVKTCKLPKEQKGVYAGLVMTSRGYCLSACPFIFAAGQKRILGSGAFLGVHEITTQPITQRIRYNETYRIVNGKKKVLSRKVVSRKNIIGKSTTKLSKSFDKKLKAYLNTMGVSLAMLDLLHLAPPSAIHTLTMEEMKSTNLVTALGNAADLVSNSLCKAATPADSCKVEKNFVVALAQPPLPQKEFQPGRSTSGPDMTFAIVRSSLAGCEPLCPEWIYADGKITAGTPALFKKILATAGKRRLPIVIRSDGGDVPAAMAMGRLIRARKLDVTVTATLFFGCSIVMTQCRSEQDKQGSYRGALASNKDYCNSACMLILAAGQKRQVELWSTIGVQKLATQKPPEDAKILKASTARKPGDDLYSDVGTYLDEMGISRDLLATMDKVPAGGLKNLSYIEQRALKLVTEPIFAARDATGTACKSSPPADNCIGR